MKAPAGVRSASDAALRSRFSFFLFFFTGPFPTAGKGLRFRVQGLGFRASGVGLGLMASGSRAQGFNWGCILETWKA